MRKIILALTILCLCLSQCSAGERIVDNVVRVRIPEGQSTSYGSGAYLGNGIVLSCAHLFRDTPSLIGTVSFQDGEQHEFVCRQLDHQWDQSLLFLKTMPTRQGMKVAQTEPQIGDPVFAYGYGTGNQVMVTSGTVQTFRSYSANYPSNDWVVMSGRVEEGSSGGPILDKDGYVIGNLWGTRPNEDNTWHTVGVVTGRTRRFVCPPGGS